MAGCCVMQLTSSGKALLWNSLICWRHISHLWVNISWQEPWGGTSVNPWEAWNGRWLGRIFSAANKRREATAIEVFFFVNLLSSLETCLRPPSFSWLELVVAKLLGSFASSKPLISDRSSCPAHQLVAGNSWTTWIKEIPRQVHMPFSTFPRNGFGATIGWCRRCHQEWDVAQQAEASYSGTGVHQNSGDEQLTISGWWGSSQVSETSLPLKHQNHTFIMAACSTSSFDTWKKTLSKVPFFGGRLWHKAMKIDKMDSPSPRARELEWQGCSGELLELCIDVIIYRCDYDLWLWCSFLGFVTSCASGLVGRVCMRSERA